MKTFTINAEGNITAFESKEAAEANLPPTGALVFSTAAGLQGYLKKFPASTSVEIWNSLTGVQPVKKFKDGATAAKRIFAELQKLGGSDATETATSAPTAKAAPKGKAKPEKATKPPKGAKKAKATKPVGNAPRETSKTAQLIELLRSKDGMTLDAICKKFGWQSHTTRALMSARRVLGEKARNHRDQRESRRRQDVPDR
jgi:hypothetical protein